NMPPEYGHLNRHYNIAKQLKKRNYNPVVFVGSSLHNTDKQIIEKNKLYTKYPSCDFDYIFVKTCHYQKNMKKRIISMLQFYHRLFKVVKDFELPDVIIGSSAHPLSALAAIKLSKKYHCKNIVEIRDLWPESLIEYGIIKKNSLLSKILYQGEKYLYKKADQLVFTMEGGKQYIIDKGWDKEHGGSIDTNKVHHINNGIVLDDFEYNKSHYQIDDPDLKCSDFFKAVYIGSIRKVNHLGMLVDVAKKLKTDGYNKIQILVYGDGNEKEMLEKRCIDEGIDNLIFKGSVDKKYIPYVLSQCDLNLMHGGTMNLGRYGISPNKSFDYLASGKPILSDITCNYDYIEKNNAGLTVENSIDAIEEGLIQFSLLTKDHYQEMCKNAKETAKQYDFSVLTEKLIEIIES
ncbi:MAG: glycosyltransferase family 4 protein, partial [Eubacterium sp.]